MNVITYAIIENKKLVKIMLIMKKSMIGLMLVICIFSVEHIGFMQEKTLPVAESVDKVKKEAVPEKAPEEFIITKADQNRTIKVRPNDTLQIRLTENPSTGYTWKFSNFDDRYFDLLNIENFIPNTLMPMVGQPGLKVITLKAKKVGTSTLDLLNYRDWEGAGNAIDQFSVTVTVVDKAEDEVKKEK